MFRFMSLIATALKSFHLCLLNEAKVMKQHQIRGELVLDLQRVVVRTRARARSRCLPAGP